MTIRNCSNSNKTTNRNKTPKVENQRKLVTERNKTIRQLYLPTNHRFIQYADARFHFPKPLKSRILTTTILVMMLCSSLTNRIQPWLRDYDRLQSFAVILIYLQIGCALIGSLGALYNGVLLINLGIALFALVAIESSSQSLARTYAVLLFCAILVDVLWFVLFTNDIWTISSKDYGQFFIFSVKLTFTMQSIGFSVRLSSSFFWIQMYRLGVSHSGSSDHREADFDLRNSFLSPAPTAVVRQTSNSDEVIGGSIYDPAYYSSLFEDGHENEIPFGGRHNGIAEHGSTSLAESSLLKTSIGGSFQAVDEQTTLNNSHSV